MSERLGRRKIEHILATGRRGRRHRQRRLHPPDRPQGQGVGQHDPGRAPDRPAGPGLSRDHAMRIETLYVILDRSGKSRVVRDQSTESVSLNELLADGWRPTSRDSLRRRRRDPDPPGARGRGFVRLWIQVGLITCRQYWGCTGCLWDTPPLPRWGFRAYLGESGVPSPTRGTRHVPSRRPFSARSRRGHRF